MIDEEGGLVGAVKCRRGKGRSWMIDEEGGLAGAVKCRRGKVRSWMVDERRRWPEP